MIRRLITSNAIAAIVATNVLDVNEAWSWFDHTKQGLIAM